MGSTETTRWDPVPGCTGRWVHISQMWDEVIIHQVINEELHGGFIPPVAGSDEPPRGAPALSPLQEIIT